MSFGALRRNARDWELISTDSRTNTASSNQSSHTDCSNCIDPGSGMQLPFIGRTISECTSCPSEPNVAGCCRFPANAEERQHLSECIDAGCAEPVCDECSHHEDCCDDCLVDCGSDCGTSFGCDELDVRVDDTYVFEGSHSELFGDQTAQTFGFGCRLPRLAMDNTITESGNFGKTLDDTRSSTLPAHGMNQSYPGSKMQSYPSFQTPWAPHTPLNAPEATTPSGASYDSDFLGPRNHELAPANVPPLARNSDPLTYTSDSTHDSPDPMDFSPSAHYDHVNLLTGECDPTRPFHPSLRCQWADSNGKPCGKNLRLGNDMHEHLKSAHGVKIGVYCRWVGCTVGVFGASLHKFASSVERHTWGHSGYRPYKCSACNEGFAAASVRDEHYTNIHLRKKVFSCDVCSHQCTSATNLKRHKDDKHSADRFQCEFCNRNDKRRLFPRGPNLARHFRNCKYVQAQFPEAAAAGKAKGDWLPPGYKRGHHGMDRAKVTPPDYLPAQMDT